MKTKKNSFPNVAVEGARPPLVLALDIGTSSVRAVVYDSAGRAVDGLTHQISYEIRTSIDGEATFDANALLDLMECCVDECSDHLDRSGLTVDAAGVSCFWHSLVGLDTHFSPVTPVYYWADNRSASQVNNLRTSLDQGHWRSKTGCVFHSSYWPGKLAWLRETGQPAFQATKRWTSAADFFAYRWLARDWTSLCMATGTGLVDLERGDWVSELVAALKIDPATLPAIVDRTESACLVSEYARRWPALAGATWYPALGDGACATIGCGSKDNSRVAMTLGTSGAVRVPLIRPVGEPVPLLDGLWVYRLDRSVAIYGAAISNGGLMLDWTRDIIADLNEELSTTAEMLEPGAHGLTVLPFIAGERAPIWNDRARGVIAGLSAATTRADILRASMEAVAFRLAALYDRVAPAATPGHVVIANGAALLKSDLLLSIVADTLGRPLVALDQALEASARGAALLALQQLVPSGQPYPIFDPVTDAKQISPNLEHTSKYARERDRQERLLALLYPANSSWDRQ